MTSIVIVDCDGVLLNWRDSFNRWAYRHQFVAEIDQWPRKDYSPPQMLGGVEHKLMEVFNQTHFVSKLPPIEGAIEAIQAIHRAGYALRVVTAFSDEYESMVLRQQNLNNVFGNVFEEIVCLPIGSSKAAYLRRQPKDSYFIEDSAHHLEEALEVGFEPGRLGLISQDYNTHERSKYAGKIMLGSWPTFRRNILGE